MTLPIKQPFPPMEAKVVDKIPTGSEWGYEPKWDGFRCLVFRDGTKTELQSKSGQPLSRYFPELIAAVQRIRARRFVLDGEIIIATEDGISFDDLLQRIHPAASRVKALSESTPAMLLAFDLLADDKGRSLLEKPLSERRERLTEFAGKYFNPEDRILLSPVTLEVRVARDWLARFGRGMDGVMAKRLDLPYLSDERTGMVKIKRIRSADCVVGGFRYASSGGLVGSLLLGLYNDEGLLDHVGFTSSFSSEEKKSLTPRLKKLIKTPGFTGRAPGGPSRWSTKRSSEWQPLDPRMVVEVQYDHFDGGRFRHGTKLLRFRPDKAPRQCTFDQVEIKKGMDFSKLFKG
jgi:ATP-dependent DNA ligase